MEKLSAVEMYLISEILEDCLKRINIIFEVSFSSKNYTLVDQITEDNEKNNECNEIGMLLIEENAKRNLVSTQKITPEEKSKNDKNIIQKALTDVINEIRTFGTYESLKNFNLKYNENRKEINEIYESCIENIKLIPKMKNDIEEIEKKKKQDLSDIENRITYLNFELEKNKTFYKTEKEYFEKECTNVIAQAQHDTEKEEKAKQEAVTSLQRRLELETAVDQDSLEYYNQVKQDTLEKLEYWKYKFFDDQMEYERKLRSLEKFKGLHEKKLNGVAEKLKLDKEYLARMKKEDEEAEIIENERVERLKAIIRIQAWYKGYKLRKNFAELAAEMKKEKESRKKKMKPNQKRRVK